MLRVLQPRVYGWEEETSTPTVREPFQCVVACSSCSPQCEAGAIAFPSLTILKVFLEGV